MTKQARLRNIAVLIGAFIIAYTLTIIIHELGHGITILLSGHRWTALYLNPFATSYATWSILEGGWGSPVLITYGAVAFSLWVSILLILLMQRTAKIIWLPLYLTGIVILLFNGSYYLSDPFFGQRGDPYRLVQVGEPAWQVVGVGALLLVLGMLLLPQLGTHFGLRLDDPGHHWFALLAGGVLPYFLAKYIYALLFDPIYLPVAKIMFVGTSIILALVSWLPKSWMPEPKHSLAGQFTWGHAVGFIVVALLMIVVELVIWRPQI